MIKVITDHPIAIDSDDHHHPDGVHLDNWCNPTFVNEIQNYFKGQKINFLDLGCAGAGLMAAMHEQGHNSVGLEGSDHCLNIKPDVIAKLGALPAGAHNWRLHGNSRLFTCDVSYDYEIQQYDKLMQFDLITSFDVMEHLEPSRIDKFNEMVHKHLKPGGMYVAAIALFHLVKDKILDQGQVEYHKSLFSHDQWRAMLNKYLTEVDYPFSCTNRSPLSRSDYNYVIYAGIKK